MWKAQCFTKATLAMDATSEEPSGYIAGPIGLRILRYTRLS
jgi:hypothetical protein